MNIPFHKPHISDDEVRAVEKVLRSGWLTMGHETTEFEKEFADFTGAAHAVSVSSCTAALHCALLAAGVGPGDEVLVPAMTFAATAEAVMYCGARPVYTDVDVNTHCMDLSDAAKRINPKTRAIIPVHYSGQPCDMDAVIDLAHVHDLVVVEDAAHALPAFYKGRMLGSFGDICCFSFYATKTITTGEGGMITTAKEDWTERISRVRLHGISRDAWKRYSAEGTWQYDIEELGYKYNMTDLNAALGRVQLRKCFDLRSRRRRIVEEYDKAFSQNDFLHPYFVTPDSESAWHLYPVRLKLEKLGISRDIFIRTLKERGISASVHFIPLYRFSFYGADCSPAEYPGSEWIFDRVLSLPLYPDMTPEEVDYVIENVLAILRHNGK